MPRTRNSRLSEVAEKLDFNKTDLRKIILYEFTSKTNPNDVVVKVNQAAGKQLLTKVTVKRWYKKFESENWELEDKPRKGRPRLEVNTEDIVEVINDDPTLTINEISNQLKISDKTIRKRLREANYVYDKRRWIQLDDENDENEFYQLNE